MFIKYFLALFLISLSCFASNLPQAANVITVGNGVVSGPGLNVPMSNIPYENFIELSGVFATTEAIGDYRKLTLSSANAGGTPGSEFQIDGASGSRKFFVTLIKYSSWATSTTCSFRLGYGDNPVGANEGTTTPQTNAITYGTGTNSITAPQFTFSTATALGFGAYFEQVIGVSIPTGKYMHMKANQCNVAAGVSVIGYLK